MLRISQALHLSAFKTHACLRFVWLCAELWRSKRDVIASVERQSPERCAQALYDWIDLLLFSNFCERTSRWAQTFCLDAESMQRNQEGIIGQPH